MLLNKSRLVFALTVILCCTLTTVSTAQIGVLLKSWCAPRHPNTSCSACRPGIYQDTVCTNPALSCWSTVCAPGLALDFATCKYKTSSSCVQTGWRTSPCNGCTDYSCGCLGAGGTCGNCPCLGAGTPIGAWDTWPTCS